MPCCVSSLLKMPILVPPACEWLLGPVILLACWQCLSLALQTVSEGGILLCFQPADNACPWHPREWVVVVSCYVSILLTMPCSFSLWVAVIAYCASSLLTVPILGLSVCEWLWCLIVFLIYWQCLSLTLQCVSSYDASCVSGLLPMPVLDSPDCEWLWCLVVFIAYWQCLSWAL